MCDKLDNFKAILKKLEDFIRRYYINDLIKGAILFFSIGLLFVILTLLIEHFLWLNQNARAVLFWLFIVVEFVLFSKFICVPLAKLLKLQRGINYEDASKLIGEHFPEVNDKLLNVLQLSKDATKSELLLASINQKALELNPIPFKLAVNFKQNLKYIKYAIIPVLIILTFILIGKINWFTDSYKRVVDYNTAYEPPAPFQFLVINDSLQTLENRDFKLLVKTIGDVSPEEAEITYNNETYVLQQSSLGGFEYVFSSPKTDITFHMRANGVSSKPYVLELVEVPTLVGFDMALDYPNYTQKKDEILKSTGNAMIPEGTKVTWKLQTKATDQVAMFSEDTLVFTKLGNQFQIAKTVFKDYNYSLSTSNAKLKNFENLSFNLEVIKDQFPEISLEMVRDSVDLNTMYFKGIVNDDYGLQKLNLVYYKSENESDKNKINISISKTNVDQFLSAFPNQLELEAGVPYSLYFEVFDNDVLHNYKRTKSEVFNYRGLTEGEKENKKLEQQHESISNFNKSLEQFDKNEKMLEELSNEQKAKQGLSFNDKKKLQDILKKQQQQETLMKQFNKSFQENMKSFKNEKDEEDAFKEALQDRLEDNEKQLKQDEKLLKELEELQDKINNDELSKKLDELSKKNSNQKRSLKQLVELTKRFYVAKKMEKLQQELDQLADDQLQQANESKEENTSDKQETLNKRFDDLSKELDALAKDNKELKKPMALPNNKKESEHVEELQQDAKEKLEESEEQEPKADKESKKSDAKKSQKQAGEKMKKMSSEMKQSMQMESGEQLEEDTEMLRQILDNVLLFSFDEEQLMNNFKRIQINHNKYASYLRQQYDLREYFEHVDDSLFALSLRQPMLSEQVNTEISDVYFNIDKALDEFSENRMYQGISSQQYVFTAANNLANFLSEILNNLQDQLNASASSSGQGSKSKQQSEGEGQLQDIIMSQEQLNKEMKSGMEKNGSKSQGDKDGESGKDGDKQGEGDGKKSGQSESGDSGGYQKEGMNGELYGIYQRQQELRNQLENKLEELGLTKEGRSLLNRMEQVEMDLLNDGFTKETNEKMIEFEHQLLKLEEASFQQDQDNKRESNANSKTFKNNTQDKLPSAKQYFNTNEILNRQVLPLQQNYKNKVQQYFNAE